MILTPTEVSQMLSAQSKAVGSMSEPFLENLVVTTSFRETLMSSALANDFLFNEDFDGVSNANLNLVEREEHFADRFEMTGVLGHMHVISDTHVTTTEYQSQMFSISNYSNNQDVGQYVDTRLDVDLQDNLKLEQRAERIEQSIKTKKIIPVKKMGGKKLLPSLGDSSTSKSVKKIMDLSHFLEADVTLLLSLIHI